MRVDPEAPSLMDRLLGRAGIGWLVYSRMQLTVVSTLAVIGAWSLLR